MFSTFMGLNGFYQWIFKIHVFYGVMLRTFCARGLKVFGSFNRLLAILRLQYLQKLYTRQKIEYATCDLWGIIYRILKSHLFNSAASFSYKTVKSHAWDSLRHECFSACPLKTLAYSYVNFFVFMKSIGWKCFLRKVNGHVSDVGFVFNG